MNEFGACWNADPKTLRSVWILGVQGQCGQTAFQYFSQSIHVRGFSKDEWDITDPEATRYYFEKYARIDAPDVLLNAAAMTGVDACERNPDLAFNVNARALEHLVSFCERYHVGLIHISSDYLFDRDEPTPIPETAQPNPVNVYGKSKLKGEQIIHTCALTNNYLIVRTSWVFSRIGGNFLTWVLDMLQQGKEISCVTDQIGCPTSASSLIRAIHRLWESGVRGWVHFCNQPPASRFEEARTLAQIFHLPEHYIHPISSRDMQWIAQRPKCSVLDCSRYTHLVKEHVPRWVDEFQKLFHAPFPETS